MLTTECIITNTAPNNISIKGDLSDYTTENINGIVLKPQESIRIQVELPNDLKIKPTPYIIKDVLEYISLDVVDKDF